MIACSSFCAQLHLLDSMRPERLPDFDRTQYGLKSVRAAVLGHFVFVNFDPDAAPLAEIGQLLDLSENAVKQEVRRLKLRFGELLRTAIAATDRFAA